MPRLKLRDWQFRLMLSAVQDNADSKLAEIHSILMNYHSDGFPLTLTDVKSKAISFLEYHKKEKELYDTKIHLFKLEHNGNASEEESMLFQEYVKKRDYSASVISRVEEGLDQIEKLNNIADTICKKISEKDLIKIYDDDFSSGGYTPGPDDSDPFRQPLTG